ncbi:MAG: cell division protein FtsA [Pseudomonadota bacterium]
MATVAKRRLSRVARQGLIAGLDIGCSKVSCLIGEPLENDPRHFEFRGGGRQQSRGFEGGVVTDMEALERAIRLAVEDAERQAGEAISSVILSVTGPRLEAEIKTAKINISGRAISSKDVKKVQTQAVEAAKRKNRDILTAFPVVYKIDDQEGIRDPRGMFGEELSAVISLVTAPSSLVKTLLECVGRAHLTVDQIVPAAIAAGYGALVDDERNNGAICVDMGAGVTTSSVFLNGVPAWISFVPSGGQHVTSDLAQGLGTTFAAAERIKTLHGGVDAEGVGASERVECPVLGDDGRLQAGRRARADLARIIGPRVDELLEFVVSRLAKSPMRGVMPSRVVFTGGASQIRDLKSMAESRLGLKVRMAKPVAANALGDAYAGPAFSTASGLLTYALSGSPDVLRAAEAGSTEEQIGKTGWINRVFRWLRENF